jgi:hypothetical protein
MTLRIMMLGIMMSQHYNKNVRPSIMTRIMGATEKKHFPEIFYGLKFVSTAGAYPKWSTFW